MEKESDLPMFISNQWESVRNHIEPDTRYSGVAGCELAIMENEINNFALFKTRVYADAHEITMLSEGASDYEVQYFIEGALSDLWDKLKEFIKKIWAKLKAILTGFIAKLEAFMGKNGYEFYKKYEKILHNGVHLKDVKTKYKKVKNDKIPTLSTPFSISGYVLNKLDYGRKDDVDQEDIDNDMIDKISEGTFKDLKELKKDVQEYVFDDEETEELEDSKVSEYIKYITDKKSVAEEFKKVKSKIDSNMNYLSKEVDKASDEVRKAMTADTEPDKSDEKDYDKSVYKNGVTSNLITHKKLLVNKIDVENKKMITSTRSSVYSQKSVSAMQRVVGSFTSCWSKYSSIWMECCKEMVAQSRRIAAIIVAYRSRHKNESSLIDLSVPESDIYYQAIGEAAEWEVMSELE